MEQKLKTLSAKLINAKNKEELDKSIKELKSLEKDFVNINTDFSGIKNCQNCQLLNSIFRKAWELSKKEFHTFEYQCETCQVNWTSTFCK